MYKILQAATFILVLSSCGGSESAEEVREYCECLETAEGEAAKESCRKMRDAIIRKYEFDPEALEDIREELAKCSR